MRLSVENLSVEFAAPGGGILPALGTLSCEIESGTFVCVLGPSGCGKSTLIRVLAGLQSPTRGQVWIGGKPILKPVSSVGLMFQDSNLMPWRTVLDNIGLPLELAGITAYERKKQVCDLLPILGMQGFEDAYPGELSGGMAQRVALGRVLIQQPEVLLLDEPFGALDALTREQISIDLLRVWAQFKQTVMMVTHDINEAILLADRVLVLSQRPGKIVDDIPINLERPRQLEMSYQDSFAKLAQRTRQAIFQSASG